MAESSLLVPVAQVAKIFNVTERRVQQLASDGIIPKAERGKYHFIEAVQGYIKFLQGRAFGKTEVAADSHHERTRLLKANADIREIEHQEMLGELVQADVVRRQGYALATILKNNLQSMPDRVAAIVAAESDPVKVHDTLSTEVINSLNDVISAMESTEVDDATLDITRHQAAEQLEQG